MQKGRRGCPGGLVISLWWCGYCEVERGRRGSGFVSMVRYAVCDHEADAMTHGKPARTRAFPAWSWLIGKACIVGGSSGCVGRFVG